MPAATIVHDLAESGALRLKAYQYILDVPATNGTIAMNASDSTTVLVPKGGMIWKMKVDQINRSSAITLAGTSATRLILYRDAATDDVLAQATAISDGATIAPGALSYIHAAGMFNPGPANVALADVTPATLKLGTGLITSGVLGLASGAGFSKISTGLANALRVQFWVAIPYYNADPDKADPKWS
ncbi:MAG: hypothetical protein ACIAQU_04365 [Phycisphaerales bacterium JB064]